MAANCRPVVHRRPLLSNCSPQSLMLSYQSDRARPSPKLNSREPQASAARRDNR
ncbi:hypothetical protein B8V81_4529 [Paenibacillus pasadenensis]|uniref:Uncharacterized protein n=1 Tax=Paenibacillus pasadenensis TaxID=217090 RepID=A0A2N5N6Z1_9BACL|nr:hypothetical protein B8V81_4529 [Paenibacillus pasadenensis]